MARKSERQTLLESGEARGILRPEHKAELNALRARQGGGESATRAKSIAADVSGLEDAAVRSRAATDSLRLYDDIKPVMDRFNGGPQKGAIYDILMPNGGGFLDKLGSSTIGFLGRGVLPTQDQVDYKKIDTANAERVALRQMEQKGQQTAKDAELYGRAEISPSNNQANNRDIAAKARTRSLNVKIEANLRSQWVGRYGSISRLSPNGMSFQKALDIAERDFLRNRPRRAPPSTRAAASGWSAVEVK